MTFSCNIPTVCVNYMHFSLTRHSFRPFCCVPACPSRPFGISGFPNGRLFFRLLLLLRRKGTRFACLFCSTLLTLHFFTLRDQLGVVEAVHQHIQVLLVRPYLAMKGYNVAVIT